MRRKLYAMNQRHSVTILQYFTGTEYIYNLANFCFAFCKYIQVRLQGHVCILFSLQISG